ncbi:sialic acid O-acetyltransferase [Flavobacteriales bacterium]|nr:sialic acid O-acetyltransferase [Flavobacteriales bacterium]
MQDLIIVGARGLGREVLELANDCISDASLDFTIKGFLDENQAALSGYQNPMPVISSVEEYEPTSGDVFIVAMGDPLMREKYVAILNSKGCRFINLIHPTAVVGQRLKIGIGNIIGPYVQISCDVAIGSHTLIQSNSILGHDVSFGDYSTAHAFTFLGGNVVIEKAVTLATRSTILPNAVVESKSKVGACSLVLKKVGSGTTVFGIPAKKIWPT